VGLREVLPPRDVYYRILV